MFDKQYPLSSLRYHPLTVLVDFCSLTFVRDTQPSWSHWLLLLLSDSLLYVAVGGEEADFFILRDLTVVDETA